MNRILQRIRDFVRSFAASTFIAPFGDGGSGSSMLERTLDAVQPAFPIEFIALIKSLVLTTPNLSQTVKRTVNLANTGLTFKLIGASEAIQARADIEIRNLLDAHPGLINRMLRQIVITGALSTEGVPTMELDGIEEIRLVPVEKIRFKRERIDAVRSRFAPVQISESGAFLTLNPEQYVYEALETDDDSPYAIPPFLAALRSVYIQKQGQENVPGILSKIGLLGLLSILRKKPRPMPGEDPISHSTRLEKELRALRDSATDKIKKGMIVAYDDVQVQHNQVTGDTRGYESVWRSNEEQMCSGLDMDPAMLGRNYSTTETYGGVVFTAFVSKLGNIRYPVKRALKRFIDFHLRAKGYKFERLSADWGPDASLNPERDALAEKLRAETDQIRVQTAAAKVLAGIIDRDQAAQELGYEKATGEPAAQAALKLVAGGKVIQLADVKKKSKRRSAA